MYSLVAPVSFWPFKFKTLIFCSHFLKCQGIARRLVRAALNVAARKRVMRYDDLKKVDRGIRRFFHDDITVVVIFIDHELLGNSTSVPEMSVKGFRDSVGSSDFNILRRN